MALFRWLGNIGRRLFRANRNKNSTAVCMAVWSGYVWAGYQATCLRLLHQLCVRLLESRQVTGYKFAHVVLGIVAILESYDSKDLV